jgi:tetratricopeptide (TPR) repeat protein
LVARHCFVIMIALLSVSNYACAAEELSDFEKGLALRAEGKNSQAVAMLKKVPPDSANYIRALVQMGAALEDSGKKKEAADAYQRALSIDPTNPTASRNLDQLRSAETTEVGAQAPNPAKEELIRNGVIALQYGNFKKALEVFRLSRGLFPGDPRPLFYSGLTLESQGDLRGAISLYERTMESFPDYVPARINQILDLLMVGDQEGAARNCRKAIEIFPDDRQLRSLISLLARLGAESNDATLISKEIKGP